jgi:hypothetical protein
MHAVGSFMPSQDYELFLDAFVDEYVAACHKGNVIVKAAQQFFRRYPGLLPGVDVSAPDAFSDLKGEALAKWNVWFNVSARVRRGIHVLTLEQRFKNYIPPCAAKFCGGAPAGSFPRMVERGMRAALPVTITRAHLHLFKEDLEVFCEPLREKQRLLEPQRGLARRDFDNQASGLYISYHLQREAVPVDEHGRPTKQITLRFPKRLYAAIGQYFDELLAKPYEAVKNPSMTERYEACKFYVQHGYKPGESVPQYHRRPPVREMDQYVTLVTLRMAMLKIVSAISRPLSTRCRNFCAGRAKTLHCAFLSSQADHPRGTGAQFVPGSESNAHPTGLLLTPMQVL